MGLRVAGGVAVDMVAIVGAPLGAEEGMMRARPAVAAKL